MPARRVNPNRVKLLRTYTVADLARCLDVHKNTVRHWQDAGLAPIDRGRPILFHGDVVRQFLTSRNRSRKQSCGPGQMYCVRCRAPREPALGMVDFIARTATTGNLRALCGVCDTVMNRTASKDKVARIMPGLDVQFAQAQQRLSGRPSPSPNCDFDERGEP